MARGPRGAWSACPPNRSWEALSVVVALALPLLFPEADRSLGEPVPGRGRASCAPGPATALCPCASCPCLVPLVSLSLSLSLTTESEEAERGRGPECERVCGGTGGFSWARALLPLPAGPVPVPRLPAATVRLRPIGPPLPLPKLRASSPLRCCPASSRTHASPPSIEGCRSPAAELRRPPCPPAVPPTGALSMRARCSCDAPELAPPEDEEWGGDPEPSLGPSPVSALF